MKDTIWICGDAEKLPIDDKSVDVYTIAFGLRNVTNIQVALEKPKGFATRGRFLCLEFSDFSLQVLKPLYEAYSFKVIPQIGNVIANDKDFISTLLRASENFLPNPTYFSNERQV